MEEKRTGGGMKRKTKLLKSKIKTKYFPRWNNKTKNLFIIIPLFYLCFIWENIWNFCSITHIFKYTHTYAFNLRFSFFDSLTQKLKFSRRSISLTNRLSKKWLLKSLSTHQTMSDLLDYFWKDLTKISKIYTLEYTKQI